MSSPDIERRGAPRHAHEVTVDIKVVTATDPVLNPGQTFRCRSHDISIGGLQIRIGHPLSVGTTLTLWVISPLFQDTMIRVGTVLWSREIDTGIHAAGIVLLAEESENITLWRNTVALMPAQAQAADAQT